MKEPHFVKVWTEGDPTSNKLRIYGATEDGRKYLINHKDLEKYARKKN